MIAAATRTATCAWHHCTKPADKGFIFCPVHETEWAKNKRAHEPETDERQFVRYAYADDCKLPYRPASREPKPSRTKGYHQPPINRVLDALLAAGCTYKPSTTDVDSWQAFCPTHDDVRDPSLHIKRNHDGMVWLKCWAGCAKEGILHALGLEWRDLWDKSEHDAGRKNVYVKPLIEPHIRQAMLDMLRRDDERRAAA